MLAHRLPGAALLTALLLAAPLAPAGLAVDGRPDVAVVTPAAPPSADACLPAVGIVCANLPLFVDENGDTMTGDLAFSLRKGVAFQGGRLTGDGALFYGSRAVCVADLPHEGCGDVTGVEAGFGLRGGGTSGDMALAVSPSDVQARVRGWCSEGFLQRVAEDGSVACGRAVTEVVAGEGLWAEDGEGNRVADGTIRGAGTLRVAPPAADALGGVHAATCAKGMVVVGIDAAGDIACAWSEAGNARTLRRATVLTEPVRAAEGEALHGAAMAVGGDGVPRLAYIVEESGAMEVRVATCQDAHCVEASVATLDRRACTACAAGGVDLLLAPPQPEAVIAPMEAEGVVSPSDLPQVAYAWADGGDLQVKVARCETPDCGGDVARAVVDQVAGAVSPVDVAPSVAVGLDGTLLVAHAHQDAQGVRHLRGAACGDLALQGCGPGSGAIDLHQSGGSGGLGQPALAVGLDGSPVLAYHEWAKGAASILMLKCGTPDCFVTGKAHPPVTLNTLTAQQPVASWSTKPALLLDGRGLPQVAYVWPQPSALDPTQMAWVAVHQTTDEGANGEVLPVGGETLDWSAFVTDAAASPAIQMARGHDGPMLALAVGPSDIQAARLTYVKCADPHCERAVQQELAGAVSPSSLVSTLIPCGIVLGADLRPLLALERPGEGGPDRIQMLRLANEFGVGGLWRKG